MVKVLTAPRMARCIGCDSCMLACARMIYKSFSPHRSAIQIRSRGGVMGRMVANICTACAEPAPCVPMQACALCQLARVKHLAGEREGANKSIAQARKLDDRPWQALRPPPAALFVAP